MIDSENVDEFVYTWCCLFTFNFDIGERTLIMGNAESSDSHADFHQRPRSSDGSSANTNHQYHQTPSFVGSSANASHRYHEHPSYDESSMNTSYRYHQPVQPSLYAGSLVNTKHQHKQQPTYIADNFSSLDQVFTATFCSLI